jgi:hypothetical protein
VTQDVSVNISATYQGVVRTFTITLFAASFEAATQDKNTLEYVGDVCKFDNLPVASKLIT